MACSTQVPIREPAGSETSGCTESISIIISRSVSKAEIPHIKPHLEFVNSVDDFYMHMFNHVKNVENIADEIFSEIQKNPDQLKSVFHIPKEASADSELKSLMKKFVQKHDASKINTDSDFLSKINRKKLIIYELYSLYGKNFKDLSLEDQKIIQELNLIDKGVHDKFMSENNVSDWKIKFLDEVEKLADGIERGSNPVTAEEMSKKPWMESEGITKKIDQILNSDPTTDEITRLRKKLDLTLTLEKRYKDIALPYKDYQKQIHLLEKTFQRANIQTENLKPFSLNILLDEFKKVEGDMLNIDDPKWVIKFNEFFFINSQGKLLLENARL